MRDGKYYIRKVFQITGNAFAEDPATFDEFTNIARPQHSVPVLMEALSRLTKLSEKYATQLSLWDGSCLAVESGALLGRVKNTDADQENKLMGIPKKTEEY